MRPANTQQQPDARPGNYYITIVRGHDYRCLAGPFRDDHAGALALVGKARDIACALDPRAHFDAFGTARLPDGYTRPGILNPQLGL
ncbi:MAG: hypothetical protein ACE5FS_03460 [Paracoccaceae bacterium]